MRIILWIGNEENQKALANKIASRYSIIGIVTEARIHKSRFVFNKVIEKVIERIFIPSIGRAWWGMKKYYEAKFTKYPNVELLNVENINSEKAFDFTKKLNPDLILVSGTRLIKEKMLSIKPKVGILNLHTGLSPYIKGGPNCTNWCIATKQFHLIGNTIMWIDSGIDSGNIVTTAFTNIDSSDNLLNIHIKVMEHAHSLYLNAIDFLNKGYMSNVKQSEIAKGKIYYTKKWTLKEKFLLVKNLKLYRKILESNKIEEYKKGIRIVKID